MNATQQLCDLFLLHSLRVRSILRAFGVKKAKKRPSGLWRELRVAESEIENPVLGHILRPRPNPCERERGGGREGERIHMARA